jgi:hypothetical protein
MKVVARRSLVVGALICSLVHSLGLIAAVSVATGAAALDGATYPDLQGQWSRLRATGWDPDKPWGRRQQPPLTAEYQAIFEANLAEQAAGAPGDSPSWYCLPYGMPQMMMAYDPMEFVVTPTTTYVLTSHNNDAHRRIFTDGRNWPQTVEPTFKGYSIGKWIDEDGDGRYDVLEVETRHLKGPRTYDASGIPFHRDDQTVIKERISLDNTDRNLLRDEITVIDHALTRPWTVTRTYRRSPDPQPEWNEEACAEGNEHVRIGNAAYFLSADGRLMPVKKGQPPPDLKYFQTDR